MGDSKRHEGVWHFIWLGGAAKEEIGLEMKRLKVSAYGIRVAKMSEMLSKAHMLKLGPQVGTIGKGWNL